MPNHIKISALLIGWYGCEISFEKETEEEEEKPTNPHHTEVHFSFTHSKFPHIAHSWTRMLKKERPKYPTFMF